MAYEQKEYRAHEGLTIVHETGEKSKEKAEAAKYKTSEASESAARIVEGKSESAKERVKAATEHAKEKTAAAKEHVASLFEKTGQKIEHTIHKTKEMTIGSCTGGKESKDTSGDMTQGSRKSQDEGYGKAVVEKTVSAKDKTKETPQSAGAKTATEREQMAKSAQEKAAVAENQAGRFLEKVGEKVSDVLQKTKETLVGGGGSNPPNPKTNVPQRD